MKTTLQCITVQGLACVHSNFFYSAAQSEYTPLPRAPILDTWNKYSVLEKKPIQRSWLLVVDLMFIN